MTLNDRFARGFVGGAAAALVASTLTLSSYYVGLTKLRWLDFASLVIHAHLPKGLFETIFAEIAVYAWCGILGLLYVAMMLRVGDGNYRLKGAVFGLTTWFGIYALATHVFKQQQLQHVNAATAVTHAVAGIVWGIVMAEIVRYIEHRVTVDSTV